MRRFILLLCLLGVWTVQAQPSLRLKKSILLKESHAWNLKQMGLWQGGFAGSCYEEFFMWDKKGQVLRKCKAPLMVLNDRRNDSLVRWSYKSKMPLFAFTKDLAVKTLEFCFIMDTTLTTRLTARYMSKGEEFGPDYKGKYSLFAEQGGRASGSRLLVPLRPDALCPARYDTVKPQNDAELRARLRRELLDHCLVDSDLPLFAFVPYKLPPYDTVPEHNFIREGLAYDHFIGKQDPAFASYAAEGKYVLSMPEWWANQWPFDYDTTRQMVYVNQNITPNIYQYDTSGRLLNTFGEPGRHLTAAERELKFMTPTLADTFVEWVMADMTALGFEQKQRSANWNVEPCLKWVSREYLEILYDERHNRIFRLYRKPMPGLTVKKAKPFFGNQVALLDSPYGKRPTYLQIYDMNAGGKLIYDEQLYHQNIHLMGVDENNVLWGSAFAKDGEYFSGPVKVLQFQIKE